VTAPWAQPAPAGAPDASLLPGPDETLDTLLRGRVALLQARHGYRTSVDATLLAYFAAGEVAARAAETPAGAAPGPARVLELGAGSGLVSVLLGLALPRAALTLIELQPALLARAERNLRRHGLGDRATALRLDLGDAGAAAALAALAPAALVVCNPPFFRAAGRTLPDHPERRLAHYESSADLERFVAAAADGLAPDGVTCWVYPAAGEGRLRRALATAGLDDVALLPVQHAATSTRPVRLLAAARRGGPALVRRPALVLHERPPPDGRYDAAIEAFLAGLPALAGGRG
jgi:tRNA1(Val) A37 N6-methylase TrmN6